MKTLLRILFSISFLLLFINKTKATSFTWTGAKGDNLWTSPNNWDKNSSYPGASGTADAVTFNSFTAATTITLNANVTLGSITSNAATANGVSISTTGYSMGITSGITIGVNGCILTFLGSGAVTVGGNIVINSSGNFTLGSATDATTNVTFNSTICTIGNNSGTLFNNYGKLSLSAFTAQIGNPASFNNLSTGTITASASTFQLNGSNAAINNAGGFTALTTTFQLSANPSTINNTGTFNATSCVFQLSASSNATVVNSKTFNNYSSTYTISGNPGSITNKPGAVFLLDKTTVSLTGTNFIYNYGNFTAQNASAISLTSAGSDSYVYNYGNFYAGISGSTATVTLAGTRARIENTSATLSGTTYNGKFYVGAASIVYPTSATSQMINDPACTACTFTLQSDQTGSAAVAAVGNTTGTATGARLVGLYNVERYLSGGVTKNATTGRWVYRNYRLMSSPVSTVSANTSVTGVYPVNLKYLANSAIVTGAKGGYVFPSTFNSTVAAGNPSIYLYREDITPSGATYTSGNFIGVKDITDQTNYTVGMSDGSTPKISVGDGYMFFFRGDNIHSVGTSPGKTTYPYVAVEATTFTATGYLNQGSYQPQNWVSGGGSLKWESTPTYNGVSQDNSAVRGYNLIGNPYACSINWDTFNDGSNGITSSNVNAAIYIFNPVTNQYNTYVAGNGGVATGTGGTAVNTTNANIIPSGQGFYVQANNHASTINFNENCKAPTQQVAASNLLLGTPVATTALLQYMRLTMETDSLNFNDMLIFFKASADTKYNGQEDAKYLPGNNPAESLSSFSGDSVQLAVNALPFPKTQALTIRLNVNSSASGQYTFKRGELQSIPALYEIWLMDNYKKDSLDIKNNDTYVFNIDKTDSASFGSNRFTIVIRQNPALGVHLLSFTATKATDGALSVWKTENEQNYTNFTVERSTDNGVTFIVLGGFPSTALSTYSYTDKNPQNGTDIYRLKLEDLNGAVTYSNAVKLSYSSTTGIAASNVIVYPNPASSIINLAINQQGTTSVNSSLNSLSALQAMGQTPSLAAAQNTVTASTASYAINIINITGNVVKTATSSSPIWQDSVSSLSPGTYIIQVSNKADNSVIGKSTFVKL